jgi:hypothetical protein
LSYRPGNRDARRFGVKSAHWRRAARHYRSGRTHHSGKRRGFRLSHRPRKDYVRFTRHSAGRAGHGRFRSPRHAKLYARHGAAGRNLARQRHVKSRSIGFQRMTRRHAIPTRKAKTSRVRSQLRRDMIRNRSANTLVAKRSTGSRRSGFRHRGR